MWAIGTGKVATPAIAQDIHAYIRTWLHSHYGEDAASKVIYGIYLILNITYCILVSLFHLQHGEYCLLYIFLLHMFVSTQVRILYGGSVTPESIGDLIRSPDIDGALVGGASLKASAFASIVRTAAEVGLTKGL